MNDQDADTNQNAEVEIVVLSQEPDEFTEMPMN